MASLKEISKVYLKAKDYGAKKISLLYCVSNYPSKISDFILKNIKIMKKKFNCKIGFSDHSKDLSVAAAASKAGATIFEKHICLSGVKAQLRIFYKPRSNNFLQKNYIQAKFKFKLYKNYWEIDILLDEKLKN